MIQIDKLYENVTNSLNYKNFDPEWAMTLNPNRDCFASSCYMTIFLLLRRIKLNAIERFWITESIELWRGNALMVRPARRKMFLINIYHLVKI